MTQQCRVRKSLKRAARCFVPVMVLCLVWPGVALSAAEDSPIRIGELDVRDLLEFHRRELREAYLPAWSGGRVDREHGGFLPRYDPADRRARYTKVTYDQGRGLWTFSLLYNQFGGDPEHLVVARRAMDFIMTHMKRDDDMFFEETSREGRVIHEFPNIYGDIYIFMGLAEYYAATGDTGARDQAVRTAITVFERANSPDYMHAYHNHGRARARAGHPEERGLQRLGTWQHFLGALTPTLRHIPDPRLEEIAAKAAEKVLRFHYDPVRRVGWENLPHDGTPDPEFLESGRVSNFHTIQAAWMAMDEGVRRGDRLIFAEGLEMGRTYMESVYERSQSGVGGYTDELLLYLLLAWEHTMRPEFAQWYEKTWRLALEDPNWNRACLLHHPRRLLYSIAILERILARGGQASGFLQSSGDIPVPCAD